MKRIAVVTSTRAEYGLLSPLIRRIYNDDELELDLIVTGTHLSKDFGYTVNEIEKDCFPITHKIPILEIGNSPYDISITMSNTIKGFAECFQNDRPDLLVILGDRTEMFGVACAAMNERIPIAHIHGGEVTVGAVDDCIRHSLSKMSYLHFASTEVYRKRIIQLGEYPDRVFNVGSLGAENILNMSLFTEEEFRYEINMPNYNRYAVVTYHPVTLENNSISEQINELCVAMDYFTDIFFIITGANADNGGTVANEMLKEYTKTHKNTFFVKSLGVIRYLSGVKNAAFVLGNSSSGILEAPVLGTPTVNIGDRQEGRLMSDTILQCNPDRASIIYAINKALGMKHKSVELYGDGYTSKRIVDTIKDYLMHDKINLKKKFYDIQFEVK